MGLWKSRFSQSLRSRPLLTIVVGSACFILGSGALAQADWLPSGHIYAIGDPAIPGLTLKLSAAGEMMASDPGATTRLDTLNAKLAPLAIDAAGSLAVNVHGTTEVSGHVTIDNLPAAQQVTGTVTVANLPAVMPVSGGVTVNNLPDVIDVNVTNGGLAVEPTTTRHDDGEFTLHNDFSSVHDYLMALQPVGCQVGSPCDPPEILQSSKYRKVTLPTNQFGFPAVSYLTLVSLNTQDKIAFVCAQGDQIVLRMHVESNVTREFVHPLKVTSCFIACVDNDPGLEPWNGPKCQGNYSVAGP